MNNVILKFKVRSVTNFENGQNIEMEPVINGSKENEEFWKWTPAGEIKFTTHGSDRLDFEPGDEYFITIQKSEKDD